MTGCCSIAVSQRSIFDIFSSLHTRFHLVLRDPRRDTASTKCLTMTARTTEDVDEVLAQENKIRSRHSLDRTDQRLRSLAVRLGTKLENKVVYCRIVNDLS